MTAIQLLIFANRAKSKYIYDYDDDILLTQYKDNCIVVIGMMGRIVKYNERLEELK